MEVVSDLHLHSKYSRAVSRDMILPVMASFAKQKGIDLLTASDFTHPLWMRELKAQLKEDEEGTYVLKDNPSVKFILSVEVSSIYSQDGKVRRVHSLLFAPSIETAEKISVELVKRGCNISSDGRPIVGLSPRQLLEIILGIDKECFLVPCHVWTPWFSLYGSMSGFDSIEECFGDYSEHIRGIETGLSSDPSMNWRIEELADRSILSFSDSHSPQKMGREATVFNLPKVTYANLKKAIEKKDKDCKISYTIEFYPEEGKYHYTGHRNCKIVYSPTETKEKGTICPVCGKGLTVGVMERVEKLASKNEEMREVVGKSGVLWITDPLKKHPPFAKLVPLIEILADSLESTVHSQKTKALYDSLCGKFHSELSILLKTPVSDIEKEAGEKIAGSVMRVRQGKIFISPGYDGEYGIVKLEEPALSKTEKKELSQTQLEF